MAAAGGGAPGGGSAGASGELRELTPAEAAKDDGNKAFKRGDWREAAEHYSRWVHRMLDGWCWRIIRIANCVLLFRAS
jgi:hypothetical protein